MIENSTIFCILLTMAVTASAQTIKNGGLVIAQNENGGLMAAPNDIGPYTYSQGSYQCSCYKLNGIGDWRMPTKSELEVLYQKRATIGGFDNTYIYWSSTRDFTTENSAWYIDFNDGTKGFGRFDYGSGPVRCVRNFNNDEKTVTLTPQDISHAKGIYFASNTQDFSKYEGLYVYCKNGKPQQIELPDGTVDQSYAIITSKGVVLTADGPDFVSAFTVAREETGSYTTYGYYKRTKTTLEQKNNLYKQISIFKFSTWTGSNGEKIYFASSDKISQWHYDTNSSSLIFEASGSNAYLLNENLKKSQYSVYSLKFISNLN